MSTHICILLLGSNLGNKNTNLKNACSLINKEIGNIKKKSKILETKPLEFQSEFLFLNQVTEVETSYSPINLLKKIKLIENKLGRKKDTQYTNQYKNRIIDIDVIYYNKLHFLSRRLTIPHYKNTIKRPFVKELLLPLNL